jgi:hypothetical protein
MTYTKIVFGHYYEHLTCIKLIIDQECDQAMKSGSFITLMP